MMYMGYNHTGKVDSIPKIIFALHLYTKAYLELKNYSWPQPIKKSHTQTPHTKKVWIFEV